jgi:predicted RNA-binding Zn-ribbon protein involved in translation (DUF1610 family)
MKLKLVSSNKNINSRKRLNYKVCPKCGTHELVDFGLDTICTKCEWNSCLDSVNAGLMDDLLSAYKELFNNKTRITIRSEPKNNSFQNQRKFGENQDAAIELPRGHDTFFAKTQGWL